MIAIGAAEVAWGLPALICLGCILVGYLVRWAHQAKRLRDDGRWTRAAVLRLQEDFAAENERRERELQSLREHPQDAERTGG